MTNTMTCRMHLLRELEEEQVGREFTKEKSFIGGKRKNRQEKC